MKKYDKPTLIKRERLSKVTAQAAPSGQNNPT
jgi:hypothetical protein